MKIVIVTGEPLGSYHLKPLYEEMRRSGHEFWHLIPYPEKTQGEPYDNTTADLEVFNGASRLIIVGGGYTPWSEAIGEYAKSKGVEIYLSELAYGSEAGGGDKLKPYKVSAMSRSGAEVLSRYLGVDIRSITVTGNPIAGKLEKYKPIKGRAIVMSTVDFIERDESRLIQEVVRYMKEEGFEIIIRPHPRENLKNWVGEKIDDKPFPIEACRAEYIIGYPGTVFTALSVLMAKVISLVPNKEMSDALPINLHSALGVKVKDINEFQESFSKVKPIESKDIEYLVGPFYNASYNIVKFWSS